MLLQNQSFHINEFYIPEFTLEKGKMIRFWVQVIPMNEHQTNGYWAAKQIQKTIKRLKAQNLPIKICPRNVKRGWKDYIKPKTVGEYMKKRFGYSQNQIVELITPFEIKPEYLVKDLGTAHQKVFSFTG